MSLKGSIRVATALSCIVLGASAASTAQTLEDFGYNRLNPDGTTTIGTRPLLVVLLQFDGGPALADAASYDQLIFNSFQKSANGYFLENSHRRFYWSRAGAGTYGPYSYGADMFDPETPTDKNLKHLNLAMQAAAAD